MGYSVSPNRQTRGVIYIMLLAILQILLKICAIFGLAFMVLCTVFVVSCIIRGDIKISIIKDKTEKENEW